jgi:hypothetical protein
MACIRWKKFSTCIVACLFLVQLLEKAFNTVLNVTVVGLASLLPFWKDLTIRSKIATAFSGASGQLLNAQLKQLLNRFKGGGGTMRYELVSKNFYIHQQKKTVLNIS